jgi:multiple sugar transport system substrate-binding protein
MSLSATVDTKFELMQFQLAYHASWLSRDRRVQVDDPMIRAGMVRAMGAYTEIGRKGCTPPDSVNWTNIDNNKAFLAQTVMMTPNATLSIPAALRTARPDDYSQNTATLDWPQAANGEPLVLEGRVDRAVVFKDGGHGATAREFVRSLADWGLAHW